MNARLFPSMVAVWALLVATTGPSSAQSSHDCAVTDHTFEWDRGRLHYRLAQDTRKDSSRTPVVLVHGWASSTFAWHQQFAGESLDLLCERRTVLALDLPGHGKSSPLPSSSTYSLETFTAAIQALLTGRGIKQAVLIGHSNGAPSVVHFARRHPEAVAALVAVDGAVVPVITREQVEPMLAPLRGSDYEQARDAMVRGMAGDAFSAELLEGLLAMAASVQHDALVEPVLSAADASAWGSTPVTLPTLLLLVEQPSWNASYREEVARRFPAASWEMWQGVNHFLQMQRPTAFARTVIDWLVKQGL